MITSHASRTQSVAWIAHESNLPDPTAWLGEELLYRGRSLAFFHASSAPACCHISRSCWLTGCEGQQNSERMGRKELYRLHPAAERGAIACDCPPCNLFCLLEQSHRPGFLDLAAGQVLKEAALFFSMQPLCRERGSTFVKCEVTYGAWRSWSLSMPDPGLRLRLLLHRARRRRRRSLGQRRLSPARHRS